MLCNFAILLNMILFKREIAVHKRLYFKNSTGFNYVLWLIGFAIGLAIAWNAPLQTGGVFLPPSLAGLVFSAILPLALCLVFLKHRKLKLLFILLFLNGLIFGFSSVVLSLINPGAGFVIRFVYLFSQGSGSLLMLYISGTFRNRTTYKTQVILSISGIVIICVIHYLILTKGLSWICWI